MSNSVPNQAQREQIRNNLLNMAPSNLTQYQLNEWLADQMVIEDYRYQARQKMIAALPKVVELALKDCGGGYVAATMLLNIFNRYAWQFDLVSMRNLSFDNWRACMDVLAYQTLTSPDKDVHNYIANGTKVMQDLWGRYEHSKNFIDRR
ncbi:hypothetical protein [Psychrobacter sp. 72-O-c]|uniref:DUF7673 family protein n=1 Tax=Psychrobacter sp. 72-O-c TaxID=2774125 RepID=UPI0019191878|nr:hypothetical protein [Psychrobacter sp. 72-O-c]